MLQLKYMKIHKNEELHFTRTDPESEITSLFFMFTSGSVIWKVIDVTFYPHMRHIKPYLFYLL